MKEVIILGGTGSIGTQTFELLKESPQEYQVLGFSFGKNLKRALELILEFKPKVVCALLEEDAKKLKYLYPNLEVLWGEAGLVKLATYEKTKDLLLVVSVVGSCGLMPTYKALEMGRDVLLANKETLVCAGDIIMDMAKKTGAKVYPIDSEHSAIFQCLQGEDHGAIKNLIITASGGSFRDLSRKDLVNVTKEDALKHPNWVMGAKITIDSATMMNKGFEVIEAHHLFNVPFKNIKTILHKESIVHSLVEFQDSSIKAQLGVSDMKMPILYALNKTKRVSFSHPLDLVNKDLTFRELSFKRFPCLKMAYEASMKGNIYPTVLNASNEAAVYLFLHDFISFLDIEKIIKITLDSYKPINDLTIEKIIEVDKEVKRRVLKKYGGLDLCL